MKFNTKLFPGIVLSVILLVLTGCLERREEIQIKPDGSAEITHYFEGDLDDFTAGIALPDSSDWSIRKLTYDTTKNGTVKLKMEARKEIPYGAPLPATFAVKNSDPDSLQLYFPTTFKKWNDGSRTFFEFRRVYDARMFQRYHGNEDMQIDPDLENRVMENGIFNVSQEDRDKYVDQMRFQFGMQQMFQFEDVINQLVIANKLTIKMKDSVLISTYNYFNSTLTNDKILAILELDEDSIESAYAELITQTQNDFTHIYTTIADDKKTGNGSAYRNAYNRIVKQSRITEILSGHKFNVIIEMPGSIVKTNGYTDYDSPGEVLWEFEGTDLHDRQVLLYALSMVERN